MVKILQQDNPHNCPIQANCDSKLAPNVTYLQHPINGCQIGSVLGQWRWAENQQHITALGPALSQHRIPDQWRWDDICAAIHHKPDMSLATRHAKFMLLLWGGGGRFASWENLYF